MDTKPTTHKFICVLNKKIDIGRAFNAIGHMAAGLSFVVNDNDMLRFQTYLDADKSEHKSISDNPFIVLKADNSNQIRTLRNKLLDLNIPFTDFVDTMTIGTFIDQHQKTNKTPEVDLEYFGICFMAENNQGRELTRKFSLYTSI